MAHRVVAFTSSLVPSLMGNTGLLINSVSDCLMLVCSMCGWKATCLHHRSVLLILALHTGIIDTKTDQRYGSVLIAPAVVCYLSFFLVHFSKSQRVVTDRGAVLEQKHHGAAPL